MSRLKADASFEWDGSAFDGGTGSARFTENGFEINQITWCDNGVNKENYFVDGQKATREEFDAAYDAQRFKPDPTWYTYANGVLAPWLPDNLELVSQTDPVSDTGEAKLWLEGGELPWLEWNGSTHRLNGLVTPAQTPGVACRDFDGDGENEVVFSYIFNGFLQLDLYEWDGVQPLLAAAYNSEQLLLQFNQNNVAGIGPWPDGGLSLTVSYAHIEGEDIDGQDFYRHLVSGHALLPENFFDGGYEHIRDGYPHVYAKGFHLSYLKGDANEYYFDFEFYLADETMQELAYVDLAPDSWYTEHYMIGKPVGVTGFTLRYDGTQWRVQEADALNMDYQDEDEHDDIYTAAPLDAPLADFHLQDLPENEWYKVAELPDDMIWMFSRNCGEETLLRWDSSFYKVFDHQAHTPHCVMPELKKLGSDPNRYGPLAVISHVGSGSGTDAYELVVYDLDAPAAVDYVHDWKPLAEDFNQNHTFQYDNDTFVMTLTYRGQTVTRTLTYPFVDSHDRIEREGCSLSITGDQAHYSFDENADGSFQLRLGAEFLIGGQWAGSYFPVGVTWTLRFNGSGFDVVPGSCRLQ